MTEILWDNVIRFFKEVTEIPRCTGNEKAVGEYLVDFAKKRGLWVFKDEIHNVIIKKDAQKSKSTETLILQGHTDMVCIAGKGLNHDFSTISPKIIIDGDFIRADNTSLGADNGIAVAYMLALLDSTDVKHPPIEAVFTAAEEGGLDGAKGLDTSYLKGKKLINLDSEEEGFIITGCAGGISSTVAIPAEWEFLNNDENIYSLKISGLLGGHSGIEANKRRANSNKLAGRILSDCDSQFSIGVLSISGGTKSNVIPDETEIIITTQDENGFFATIEKWKKELSEEYYSIDPNIQINVIKLTESIKDKYSKKLTKKTADKLFTALLLIPDGIQSMNNTIDGMVESSNNMAVVTLQENSISIENGVRSSLESKKQYIVMQIDALARAIGANVDNESEYQGWRFSEKSELRKICSEVYERLYAKSPIITVIHAGLECGVIGAKINDVDMVSIGPDIMDAHTPRERMNISSAKRTWQYLCDILEKL